MHDTPRRRVLLALSVITLALGTTVFTAPPRPQAPAVLSTDVCRELVLRPLVFPAHTPVRIPRMGGSAPLAAQSQQAVVAPPIVTGVAGTRILAWNNLGMHCMDSSYGEFSILPPYNTIEAQLVVNGRLVTSGNGFTLTYEAVPDASGSINTTSVGKGNWFAYAAGLFGKSIANADEGLSNWNMPGPANTPQAMLFETFNLPAPGASALVNWFRAEGIPITPWDDAGTKNPYPMMRIVARNASNAVIAQSDIVLPVSDEMDCRSCHGANTQAAARPSSGWFVDATNKDREFRMNVLKLHDDRERLLHPALYSEALSVKGMPFGLFDSALGGRPVLCASCHASEALGAPSFSSTLGNGSVPPLTMSVHAKHAPVSDPKTGLTLDNSSNRSACYTCHPGSTTLCLRGAMGAAVAADGSMAMQCQNCHGSMSQVGASTRTGWFNEPTCQSCHTGTATNNSGQIRYTSVFDSPGHERVALNRTFATSTDTPAPGLSLYRFSSGHGGLQCSACHGSTHAEFPSSHENDNVRDIQLQGHAGVMVECNTCHTTMPVTVTGGPHGMHPVGQAWVKDHHDAVSQVGLATCRACHGANDRGTELSRVQADRTFNAGDLGTQRFYRGATVGCYTCHRGPSSSSPNAAATPQTGDVSMSTTADAPVSVALPGATATVTMRVLLQPKNGTVGVQNGVATYYPFAGFIGTDSFTFAGYDGSKNTATTSGVRPAVGTVTVLPGKPVITSQPQNQTVYANGSATFTVGATGAQPLQYQWHRNAVPLGGATGASLTLSPVPTSAAGSYSVVVTNGAGSATSDAATLTVLIPPPTVSGLAPSSGAIGQVVAITGTNLTWTTQVTFNGLAAAFSVQSDSRVNATVPAGATSGPVSLTSSGGSAAAGTFTVTMPAPVISTVAPSSGGAGTAVTVTGTNFTGTTRVLFNATAAPFTVVSPTTIVTGVPAGATSGRISVTSPAGTATSAMTFSVQRRGVAPRISGFTPASGPVGTVVTITGTNLGGATSVSLGSLAAPFRVLSAGSVSVTIPSGAARGRFTVRTAGGSATSSSSFTVRP